MISTCKLLPMHLVKLNIFRELIVCSIDLQPGTWLCRMYKDTLAWTGCLHQMTARRQGDLSLYRAGPWWQTLLAPMFQVRWRREGLLAGLSCVGSEQTYPLLMINKSVHVSASTGVKVLPCPLVTALTTASLLQKANVQGVCEGECHKKGSKSFLEMLFGWLMMTATLPVGRQTPRPELLA